MGVTMEVRIGSMVFDVTDPVKIEVLRQYASDSHATELTEDDFPGETDAEARQAMLDAVTDVFIPPNNSWEPYEEYKYEQQREAFRDLTRVSDDVDRLDDSANRLFALTSEWNRLPLSWIISAEDWGTAQELIASPGALNAIESAGYDLYADVEMLMQRAPFESAFVGSECGGMLAGFFYDRHQIPNELIQPLQEVAEQYSDIAELLKGIYIVRCAGAGCLDSDIAMPHNYIQRIAPSNENRYEMTEGCPRFPSPHSGPSEVF